MNVANVYRGATELTNVSKIYRGSIELWARSTAWLPSDESTLEGWFTTVNNDPSTGQVFTSDPMTKNGANVSQLNDLSGNDRHLKQTNSSYQPPESIIDGMRSIDPNNVNQHLFSDFDTSFDHGTENGVLVLAMQIDGNNTVYHGGINWGGNCYLLSENDDWEYSGSASSSRSGPNFRTLPTNRKWQRAIVSIQYQIGINGRIRAYQFGTLGEETNQSSLGDMSTATGLTYILFNFTTSFLNFGSRTHFLEMMNFHGQSTIAELDEVRQKAEGYLAHRMSSLGSQNSFWLDELDTSHPYKLEAP